MTLRALRSGFCWQIGFANTQRQDLRPFDESAAFDLCGTATTHSAQHFEDIYYTRPLVSYTNNLALGLRKGHRPNCVQSAHFCNYTCFCNRIYTHGSSYTNYISKPGELLSSPLINLYQGGNFVEFTSSFLPPWLVTTLLCFLRKKTILKTNAIKHSTMLYKDCTIFVRVY